jgi:hypothetical protein
MFFLRRVIKFTLISFIFLSPISLSAPLTSIDTFEGLKGYISQRIALKNNKTPLQDASIALVLDFHGVIVKEKVHPNRPVGEEEARAPLVNLEEGAREFLEFLKTYQIPFVVATAWRPFDQVLDEVKKLGLVDLLDIQTSNITSAVWTLGRNQKIKFYHAGKLIALRYTDDWLNTSGDPFYRQKIYGVEAYFSMGKSQEEKTEFFSNLSFIGVVDDSVDNLDIARNDFNWSIHPQHGTQLVLFHFKPEAYEESLLLDNLDKESWSSSDDNTESSDDAASFISDGTHPSLKSVWIDGPPSPPTSSHLLNGKKD